MTKNAETRRATRLNTLAEIGRLDREIARLRALPVIATCGDCTHLGTADPRMMPADLVWAGQSCAHPDRVEAAGIPIPASPTAQPSQRCPLRGGAR